MRKTISIMCILALMLSLSSFAFATSEDTANQDTQTAIDETEVVYIDDSTLDLNGAQQVEAEEFNEGLIGKIENVKYVPEVSEDGVWESNDEVVEAVEDYCDSHYDVLSGVIYDEALEQAEGSNIQIALDEDASEYIENVHEYAINDNMSVTVTPDEIYLDEYVEKPVSKAASSSSWKYKSVATRRTLIKKVTVKKKTYSFKIYSVHTGGEVKYNGSKAQHSAAYYVYNLHEAYGSPFTFKQIAKQNEQISGTSWHYKYLGKVTGSISVITPIKVTITFKEKALGCQAITDKNGKVTKNYWPAL